MKAFIKSILEIFTHFWGKISGKYFFEDYVRVYENGLTLNRLGLKKRFSTHDLNNFLNHSKFYKFAAQFVNNNKVADVGCGSGYGTKILKESGSVSVDGYDISKSSIKYANSHYNKYGTFNICSITNMTQIKDNIYDITINSEVMEHIKEYNMEQKAMDELKRITKKNGLIIIGTPNSEVTTDHGFIFDEITELFSKNFQHYIVFENAFVPFGKNKKTWVKRLEENNTGIIITEEINIKESCYPENCIPEIKQGLHSGVYNFENYNINTKLLHNTHSWVILAINSKL